MENSTENSQLSTEFSAFRRGGHHSSLPPSHQIPPMFPHPLGMAAFVASGRAPPVTSVIPNPYISSAPTMINPLCNMANPLDSGVKQPSNFPPNPAYMNRFDQLMQCWPHGFRALDMPGGVRSTKASRESTSYLKAWLHKHKKNPYPTKNQKIWLACITNMTLTQVSTWFANARRRIKKELASGKHPHYDEDDDILPDDMPEEQDSSFVVGKEMMFTANDTKYRRIARHHQEPDKVGETSHHSSPPPRPSMMERTSQKSWDEFPNVAKHPFHHPHKFYHRDDRTVENSRLRMRSESDEFRHDEDEEKNTPQGSIKEERRESLEEIKQDVWKSSPPPESPDKPKSPFVKIRSKSHQPSSFSDESLSPSNKNKIWSLAQVASDSNAEEKPRYENPKSSGSGNEDKPIFNRFSPQELPQNFPPKLDGNNHPAMTSNFMQLMMAKMAEQNVMAWMQDMHKYIPPEHLKATKEAFANALTSSLMASLSTPQWREGAPPMFRGSVMARMAPICKDWQNEGENKTNSSDEADHHPSNTNSESSPRSIVTSSPDYGSRVSPDCKN